MTTKPITLDEFQGSDFNSVTVPDFIRDSAIFGGVPFFALFGDITEARPAAKFAAGRTVRSVRIRRFYIRRFYIRRFFTRILRLCPRTDGGFQRLPVYSWR